jgi:hypothetical protein
MNGLDTYRDWGLFSTLLRFPATSGSARVDYFQMVESNPGEVGLRLASRDLLLETYQVSTILSDSRVAGLSSDELRAVAEDSLRNGHVMDVLRNVLEMYRDRGMAAHAHYWITSGLRRWISRVWGLPRVWADDPRRLTSVLLNLSNRIAIGSRRGPANWVVVSPQLAALIEDSPGFSYRKSGIVSNDPVPFFGTLGNLRVYVDYATTADMVVLGRDTAQNSPGLYLLEGGEEFSEIEVPDALMISQKIIYRKRMALAMVGDDHQATSLYYALRIQPGKTPLWARLLQRLKLYKW